MSTPAIGIGAIRPMRFPRRATRNRSANECSENACVRTNQHVPGVFAQHAMANHLAFPERTPFGGVALAAAAPADRFKDFNCSQAAAQRLTPIAIKGKEVRSIDFELIDLALDALEGSPFPSPPSLRAMYVTRPP